MISYQQTIVKYFLEKKMKNFQKKGKRIKKGGDRGIKKKTKNGVFVRARIKREKNQEKRAQNALNFEENIVK